MAYGHGHVCTEKGTLWHVGMACVYRKGRAPLDLWPCHTLPENTGLSPSDSSSRSSWAPAGMNVQAIKDPGKALAGD